MRHTYSAWSTKGSSSGLALSLFLLHVLLLIIKLADDTTIVGLINEGRYRAYRLEVDLYTQ